MTGNSYPKRSASSVELADRITDDVTEAKGTRPSAFVIMPFSEKGVEPRPEGFFQEVFDGLIQPAAEAAGFEAQTADILAADMIHHTIVSQLVQANLVIADLTDHNPNVLFELGIRIAVSKPVVLIKAEGTPQVFDLETIRVYQYDPRLWHSTLPKDVEQMTEVLRETTKVGADSGSYFHLLTGGAT